MGQINPFAGYFAGSTQVQRLQSAEKDQQIRRNELRKKNIGLDGEELEHQVESSEEIVALHNDEPHRDGRSPKSRRHRQGDDGDDASDAPPHLDVTA